MQSLYNFIITPKNDRYNNTIKVSDKTLIVNTKIETYQSVSKEAIVKEIPKLYKGPIKKGDSIIVHHNIFRKFYDVKGRIKNSSSYFKENLFICDLHQIYLYKPNNNCSRCINTWKSNLDYCFVSPVKDTEILNNNKEKELLGIMKYINPQLKEKGIKVGDLITFTPNSEFEFMFEGKRLYCMKSNDIAITYGNERNEKEYNPSWAYCS